MSTNENAVMKRAIFSLLFVVAFLLLLCACTSKPEMNEKKIDTAIIMERLTLDQLSNPEKNIYITTDEKYMELAENVMGEVTGEKFPGSILIATDEQIIYASGTDVLQKNGEIVSPFSTYQIGSITKTYTATCVLRLIQEGKLSFDDKMGLFFPDCEPIRDITVYQLLHMNSGIPDIVNFPEKSFVHKGEKFVEEKNAGTLDSEKIITYLEDVLLEFEPGTDVIYSNTNYLLLANIIEKVIGQTYDEYLHQVIIDPLGLDNTASGDIDGVTCAYSISANQINSDNNPSLMIGAGDITSNVLDMLQYDRALFAGLLIKPEYLDMMFDFREDYSCGWMQDNANSALHRINNHWKASDVDTVYHGGRTQDCMAYNIVTNVNGERVYVIMLFRVYENSLDSVMELYSRVGSVLSTLR